MPVKEFLRESKPVLYRLLFGCCGKVNTRQATVKNRAEDPIKYIALAALEKCMRNLVKNIINNVSVSKLEGRQISQRDHGNTGAKKIIT